MEIYILNTLEIGINSIDILKKELKICGVIGLSSKHNSNKVSGYMHLGQYCYENNLDFIEIDDYSLLDSREKILLNFEIDILVVTGWQRLVPKWLIEHCNVGVIGAHGSMHGITEGRGRSPQNWALMLGKRYFYISIFKIDEGIDSGAIIDTRRFSLSIFDDIRTSYYKTSCLISEMIIDSVKTGKLLAAKFIAQKEGARYLPQRLPEDGEIDWSRTSEEIYDFIRALTKPYPGAFSFVNKSKMVIWKARPLEVSSDISAYGVGEVVSVFRGGDMLIKTGDSFLLIDDYCFQAKNSIHSVKKGDILSSGNFEKQIKKIIDRHYAKHPGLKISDDILELGCQNA